MLYFPQLITGAVAQYPFRKQRIHRTPRNVLLDGRTIKIGDPGVTQVAWELTFRAMSDQERAELEGIFKAVEGKLGEFTFLDPADNLLTWSEDFGAPAWSKGPAVTVEEGRPDAFGRTGAARLTNTGAAVQTVQQTLNIPGCYHYCFSLYVRSDAGGSAQLFRATGGVAEERPFATGSQWGRVALTGRSESDAESVSFGLALAPGAVVEVCGVQAEPQPASSAYRRTTSHGGVYSRARFDSDSLHVVSEGLEQHRCRVRVVAMVG